MGRPRGANYRPRKKRPSLEIGKQRVPWNKKTREEAAEVLSLKRVTMQKITFYEVRSNGDVHYFDAEGQEFVQRTKAEAIERKEHFEAGLAQPIERGGELHEPNNDKTNT